MSGLGSSGRCAPKRGCRTVLALLGLLVLVWGITRAAPREPRRVLAFERLPDWTGIWENVEARQAFIDESARRDPPAEPSAALRELFRPFKLFGHPPYTPEWERKHELAQPGTAATAATGKSCDLPSFPFAMEWASLFQVISVPEQTLFVFDRGTVRHVRTDGRPHPPPRDLWPTRMGDSVGRWEGTTLVIDTIERTPGPMGFGQGADLSERAHFIERVRMVDADSLEDRMTIEDPLRFSRPWEVTLRYRRVKSLDRMIPWDCEHDRNPVVNGRLVISPP